MCPLLLTEKRLPGAFIEKAQKMEILMLTVTFSCRGRTLLSQALRVERVWNFVNVPKNSCQCFTQANVNDNEILKCFFIFMCVGCIPGP